MRYDVNYAGTMSARREGEKKPAMQSAATPQAMPRVLCASARAGAEAGGPTSRRCTSVIIRKWYGKIGNVAEIFASVGALSGKTGGRPRAREPRDSKKRGIALQRRLKQRHITSRKLRHHGHGHTRQEPAQSGRANAHVHRPTECGLRTQPRGLDSPDPPKRTPCAPTPQPRRRHNDTWPQISKVFHDTSAVALF